MPQNPPNRSTISVEEYLRQQQMPPPAPVTPSAGASCVDCQYPKRPGEQYCPPCPNQPDYEVPTYIKSEPKKERTSELPTEQNLELEPVTLPIPVDAERVTETSNPIDMEKMEPTKPANAARLTYNPYTTPLPEPEPVLPPVCRLVAMPRLNEPQPDPVELEGASFILNRDLLDPENLTISGHEHAQLDLYDDKQWYLDNRSSTQTTYIRVSGPVALQPGDVILLGDRMFRFEID